jgi:hypothetical protein
MYKYIKKNSPEKALVEDNSDDGSSLKIQTAHPNIRIKKINKKIGFVSKNNIHPNIFTLKSWNKWSEDSYMESYFKIRKSAFEGFKWR